MKLSSNFSVCVLSPKKKTWMSFALFQNIRISGKVQFQTLMMTSAHVVERHSPLPQTAPFQTTLARTIKLASIHDPGGKKKRLTSAKSWKRMARRRRANHNTSLGKVLLHANVANSKGNVLVPLNVTNAKTMVTSPFSNPSQEVFAQLQLKERPAWLVLTLFCSPSC